MENTEIKYLFMAFKSEQDYKQSAPFFVKLFDTPTEVKVFSTQHSRELKKDKPDYCSTYRKVTTF